MAKDKGWRREETAMAKGRNATARRDCGHEEGDGFCTPEGQSEPPVAMGNICSHGGSFPASQGQSEPSSALGNHPTVASLI
ncbi:hypothetical protein CsSME_00020649 [Camellia sinensis var. sinensis]